jgi:hypothetical protein
MTPFTQVCACLGTNYSTLFQTYLKFDSFSGKSRLSNFFHPVEVIHDTLTNIDWNNHQTKSENGKNVWWTIHTELDFQDYKLTGKKPVHSMIISGLDPFREEFINIGACEVKISNSYDRHSSKTSLCTLIARCENTSFDLQKLFYSKYYMFSRIRRIFWIHTLISLISNSIIRCHLLILTIMFRFSHDLISS